MSGWSRFTGSRPERKRPRSWSGPLLVLLLGLAFGVAACGSDDEQAAPRPPAPPAEEPAPTEVEAPPSAADEPAAEPAVDPEPPAEPPAAADPPAEPEPLEDSPDLVGQRQLVVLQDAIAPGLDLDGPSVVHDGVHDILESTMEGLIEYPATLVGGILLPDYKVKWDGFEPRLAESWERTSDTTWTFNLRRGVLSCAGNEFTADDVVWSFQRAKSVSGTIPIPWFLANNANLLGLEVFGEDPALRELAGEVTKIDDYTVQFTQFAPNDNFPDVLEIFGLYPYDSAVMQANATEDDPWAHSYSDTEDAPGFGPYCLARWTKGSEIVLEANPDYYRGEPQFTTVIVRNVPQGANRVAAVRSGDADHVINLSPRSLANVEQDPDVTVLSWFNNENLALGVNFQLEPWSLETGNLIRQAVAWAIPYDDIIELDYLNRAERWFGLVQPNYNAYKEDRRYESAPDFDRARALLAEAGFPNGEGLPSEGLILHYVAERRAVLEPIGNRIATALAEIGIQISLEPISAGEYSDREVKGDMPMFLRDRIRPFGPDAGYASQLLFVSNENGGALNAGRYSNEDVDNAFFASQNTIGAERETVLAELQDIVMEELPMIPIALVPSEIAVRKGITCWHSGSGNTGNYWYQTVEGGPPCESSRGIE